MPRSSVRAPGPPRTALRAPSLRSSPAAPRHARVSPSPTLLCSPLCSRRTRVLTPACERSNHSRGTTTSANPSAPAPSRRRTATGPYRLTTKPGTRSPSPWRSRYAVVLSSRNMRPRKRERARESLIDECLVDPGSAHLRLSSKRVLRWATPARLSHNRPMPPRAIAAPRPRRPAPSRAPFSRPIATPKGAPAEPPRSRLERSRPHACGELRTSTARRCRPGPLSSLYPCAKVRDAQCVHDLPVVRSLTPPAGQPTPPGRSCLARRLLLVAWGPPPEGDESVMDRKNAGQLYFRADPRPLGATGCD